METLQTTCPLDCPDTCSLHVTVHDDRVERIEAGPANPTTDGFICSKVRGFGGRLEHPLRLLKPLRRVGPKGSGRFEAVAWDSAIAEIADRLRRIADEFGGESILPYQYSGSNGLLTHGSVDATLFGRLGASRLERTLCGATAAAAYTGMYGALPGLPYEAYADADTILLWGVNPRVTGIHLMPHLLAAREAGAFIAALDPRRTLSRELVDVHLPVRPGTDLPLALGLVRLAEDRGLIDWATVRTRGRNHEPLLGASRPWTLDRVEDTCGVPAAEVERIFQALADAERAAIRVGWGLERNRNGGGAIATILALPFLLGKLSRPGNGFTLSNGKAFRIRPTDLDAVAGAGLAKRPEPRSLNMTRLGRLLTETLDPPIQALVVYNANPAATVPDQNRVLRGLARDDLFTVVIDQVRTDTAELADYVLPATTFLEHRDLRVSYGTFVAGGVRPVVTPRGEARPNWRIFQELGRALGYDDPVFRDTPEQLIGREAARVGMNGAVLDPQTMMEGGAQRIAALDGSPVSLLDAVPGGRDGRVDLAPEGLGPDPYRFRADEDAYPLRLISPANARTVNSSLGEMGRVPFELEIHPDDAATRGIDEGTPVRIFNGLAEVRCRARLTPRVRPGVVVLPKGTWRRDAEGGTTATALIPDSVGPGVGGACFNDATVQVAADV